MRSKITMLPLCMYSFKFEFYDTPIDKYHVCANASLKRSKPLMSAQQPFVAIFSCSESWCVQTLHMESMDCDGEFCEV